MTIYPSAVPSTAIALQQPPSSTVDFLWWHWPTDEFAAWGQWAGGVGSILAVIVALGVVLLDHLRGRKADRQQHAQRARAVIAAFATRKAKVQGSAHAERFLGFSFSGVEIANHGPTPILEVVVEAVMAVTPEGNEHPAWATSFDASDQDTMPMRIADVLAPGDEGWRAHGHLGRMMPHLDSGEARAKITFTFLDNDGHRWRRIGNGAPKLITDAEPSA